MKLGPGKLGATRLGPTRLAHGDRARRQRGATLLVALAMMSLLAIFGLVFLSMVRLERTASATRVDGVHASLAARAGVQHAIVELNRIASRQHYSEPWKDGWGYRVVAPPAPEGRPLDLMTTTWPSFRKDDPKNDPPRTMFGGRLIYSGDNLGSPHGDNTTLLCYRLKVLDAAGQVNLNHPDERAAERMLRNLLRAAVPTMGTDPAKAAAMAAKVIAGRPTWGFRSKPEIEAALLAAGLDERAWRERVRDLLTVHSWVDRSVIRPWKLNGQPLRSLEAMPRAPINLNTAAKPALVALFAEARAETRYGTFELDFASAGRLAQQILDRRKDPTTATSTGFTPFRTWNEFEAWVDDLPASVFSSATWTPPAGADGDGVEWVPPADFYEMLLGKDYGYVVGFRDLVKAITNPNSAVNRYGLLPNHGGYQGTLPRVVDKTDLVGLTTEACFDAMGVYEISSLGLLLHRDDAHGGGMVVLAAQTQQVVAKIYEPYRLTTQQDFEQFRGFMVDGNFIPSNDRNWSYTSLGVNRPTYFERADMPLHGWPGVISWPQYSLERRPRKDAPVGERYPLASWDGYLALTNLIGVKTGDPDFVCGFARGRLEAFKVRSWWDPIDEEPSGKPRTSKPTHPRDDGELVRLSRPLSGLAPDTGDPNGQRSPRVRSSSLTEEASLLDEDPSRGNDADGLFTAGAALLNTGVLISPDRKSSSGDPQFLAFDGDNLDLTRGASIRMWVQPLLDPNARRKEVLLSFVGSREGTQRQAGFVLYKESLPTGAVNIVLEAVGERGPEDSGLQVDWNWATQARHRIEVDVTPNLNEGGFGQPTWKPFENTPLRPEWVPGTWHWVVVNIGPGKIGYNQATRYFASLQVDKYRAPSYLFYKGDAPTANTPPEFGEIMAHVAPGASSPFEPFMQGNSTSPNARGWVLPRLLGDYYHCMANKGCQVVKGTKSRMFGDPRKGEPPAVMWVGNPLPFFPLMPRGYNPGTYVQGPSYPTTSPFPHLSFNQKAALRFFKGNAPAGVPDMPLQRNAAGQWVMNFPANPDPVYGPDGSDGWGNDLGDKGYPGDAEWHMAMVVHWDELHYTVGCPVCNEKTSLPADLTTLPSIEDDPAAPHRGEPLPYSVHNSGPTHKSGVSYTEHPTTGYRSWVRTKTPLPRPQGSSYFPNVGPVMVPLTYLDDDCHGCEECDVDGPVFVGGEPARGRPNYTAPGAVSPVDPATMAYAVFDNILFINGDEARRTDWPGADRPNPAGIKDPVTGELIKYSDPAKDFEDRFFESNLSGFLSREGKPVGTGALYHRGLLELRGQRLRLASMTWTAYPTREGMQFEVGLWRLPNPYDPVTRTTPWNYDNAGLLDPEKPTWGFASDAAVGLRGFRPAADADPRIHFGDFNDPQIGFFGKAYIEGIGDEVVPPEILVLGVRLKDLSAGRGDDQPIPAPMSQSPVFEDLTLNVLLPETILLYVEEGAEE